MGSNVLGLILLLVGITTLPRVSVVRAFSAPSSVPRTAMRNSNSKHSYFCFRGRSTAKTSPSSLHASKQSNNDDDNNDEKESSKPKTYNPLRLAILRLGLTEPAMTSSFNYGGYSKYKSGSFKCAYCDNVLFPGTAKYDSKSGWPSFWRTSDSNSLQYKREFDGRLECKCSSCSSHLGHVFLDGPRPAEVALLTNNDEANLLSTSPISDPRSKTGTYLPRFCVNGAAMTYSEETNE